MDIISPPRRACNDTPIRIAVSGVYYFYIPSGRLNKDYACHQLIALHPHRLESISSVNFSTERVTNVRCKDCWKCFKVHRQLGEQIVVKKPKKQVLKSYDINLYSNYYGRYGADKLIVWISPDRSLVQYESTDVPFSSRLPVVTMDKFLNWARGRIIVNESTSTVKRTKKG